ncbi:MAG: hypothetical protein GY953_55955, partial [bacterium]|nr:hypothetical protein [bacterium]
MRLLCLCVCLAVLLMASAVPVFSQAMLEYGLAAAGGSASGVAGKGVSKGLDKILGKLKSQTDKAAAQATLTKRLTPQPATDDAVKAPANAPVQGAVRARPGAASQPGWTTSSPSSGWTQAAQQPVQRQASLADLQAVEAGVSRGDLVARLGTPSSRVLIPGDGELHEVYHFNSGRQHLGRVTLTNGS